MSLNMLIQAISTGLIPIYGNIVSMCAMLFCQGVTLSLTGVGKYIQHNVTLLLTEWSSNEQWQSYMG